jgi:hypothetical protein
MYVVETFVTKSEKIFGMVYVLENFVGLGHVGRFGNITYETAHVCPIT